MNSELKPKIRFKGFIDDWEQRKLGEIIIDTIDNRGKNPPYYCKSGIPIIDNFMIKNNGYPNLKKEVEYKYIELINNLLNNLSEQKELKKEIKDKQELLNDKVIKEYNSLTEEESKNIIVYDKWFESIENKFNTCMSNLINNLANGITNLDDEYESTLTDLNNEIEEKEKELSSLLKDLVGDDDDLKAFSEFINQLGGDANE